MRRLLVRALFLLLPGLLSGACGDDEDPGAGSPGETAEETETTEGTEAPNEQTGPLECEDIITFEELAAILGTEVTDCEVPGGFFDEGTSAQLTIREDPGGAGSTPEIQGAGWTGYHTDGICALRAAVGERRFLVQYMTFTSECTREPREAIMDAIAARHG